MDEGELRKILEAHQAWLEGTETGGRADLSRANLYRADLHNANLERAILRKANLYRANLQGTRLRDADLEGAILSRADLHGADLKDARLHGADLTRADLHEADLLGANLHSADLSRADLHAANLLGTTLRGANLQDAHLIDATGLLAEQLAGLNVSGAKLPEDLAAFEGLNFITEISKTARNTFLTLVGVCVFCWLTIGMTTDPELITNSASSSLPILQTEMPIVWFFWAAPIALLSLYLYFHLSLQPLWKGLATLPAIFPDGRTLDQRAYPWLLSGLIRAHVKRLKPDLPPLSRFQNLVSIVFAWWIVPLTLVLFWGRYLPKHDWVGTGFHIAVLVFSAGFGLLAYWLARAMLRGDELKLFRLKEWWSPPRIYHGVAALAIGVVLGALSYGSFNGDRPIGCTFSGARTWVPAAFSCIGYDVFANLEQAKLAGVELRKANLRFANGYEANLNQATLVGANLHEAHFLGADFKGAKLQGADLRSELRPVQVTQEQLDQACGDEETKLPEGLTIKPCS